MKRKRILYVISDIEKAMAFEWVNDKLDRNKFDLYFVLIGIRRSTPIEIHLKQQNSKVECILYGNMPTLLIVWWRLLLIINRIKPEVVHTHLFKANLLGLSAAWLLRIKKRIYTRHHSTLHHKYFPKAVYLDKIVNYLSTDIIALSTPLKHVLIDLEKVVPYKIHFIPHGFELSYFESQTEEQTQRMRVKYKIPTNAFPVVGVISRFTFWKGIQYIIPAFKKLRYVYPDAHIILANANGDYEKEINVLLNELPPDCYTKIGFEENIASLYNIFDIFVHTPIDESAESFGQTYVEALASGVPSVVTLSGIACDFITDKSNALVAEYENIDSIFTLMKLILDNKELRTKLIAEGKNSIRQFNLERMILDLENLYAS